MISVVKWVAQYLEGLESLWAIVGSCNIYLRMCTPFANDIDIITSREGATLIFDRLNEFATSQLSYSEAKTIRSYFFQALINDIIVEVMGDPENKIDERWTKNVVWMNNVEHILVLNMFVPVTTLEYEKYINRQLNNWSRVKDIEACIMKMR